MTKLKDYRFSMPHIGYGIVLVLNEPPMVNPLDESLLKTEMLFMIEPICINPTMGKFHAEDLVQLTNRGFESLLVRNRRL